MKKSCTGNTFHATVNGVPGPERKTPIGAIRAAMSSAIKSHQTRPVHGELLHKVLAAVPMTLLELGSPTVNIEMFEGPSGNRTLLFTCPSTVDPIEAVRETVKNLRRRHK